MRTSTQIEFFRSLKTAAYRLGHQTGFIVRERTITAFSFFLMLTLGIAGRSKPTLQSMANFCQQKISRQAIDKRFGHKGAAFLQAMLELLLCRAFAVLIRTNCRLLASFSSVKIFDSCSFELNEKLRDIFPGNGGSASAAACKMHVIYDPQAASMAGFELTRGTSSDSEWLKNYLSAPKRVQPGELLLFDQGFFSVQNLKGIAHSKAYFLTRFFWSIGIYDSLSFKRIDLKAELSNFSGTKRQFQVLLGPSKSVCSRLICLRVPFEEAKKRREKYKAIQKKRGKLFSQETFFFCDWTLLLTNVADDVVPVGFLHSLYPLRWQIELFFRSLKSILKINSINSSDSFRVKTEISAKIATAILLRLLVNLRFLKADYACPSEISIEKLLRLSVQHAFFWAQLLLKFRKLAAPLIFKDLQRIAQSCLKSIQPSRKTTLQLLCAAP